MRLAQWFLFLALAALPACQGHLVVKPLSDADATTGYEGVSLFQTAIYEQITTKTLYVEKGHILASSDGRYSARCFPVQTRQLIAAADPDLRMVMRYEPGLLEAAKFNVELADGIIKSVGVESTPDQGKTLANLASAAKDAAAAGGSSSESGPRPRYVCNDGPVPLTRKLPLHEATPPTSTAH